VTERSKALKVRVRPLPDTPEGFAGAVGRLRLESHLEPAEVAAGQSATFTLTLRGDGHIQSLPPLALEDQEGLRILPPQESSQEELARGRIETSRTWTFVLVPESPGTFELPRLSIPFYDPSVDAFRAATSLPLTLSAVAGPTDGRPVRDGEIHPIRSATVPLGHGIPWRRLPPYLFALPMALALGIQLTRHLGRRRALGEPELRLLADLEDPEARATTPRREALRLEEVWREYLVERWWMPHDTALPRWPEHLAGFAGDEAAAELDRLLGDLDYLRQAPQLSTIDALHEEILERSRSLARQLAALAALEPEGSTGPEVHEEESSS
jgi:hypothetical protein